MNQITRTTVITQALPARITDAGNRAARRFLAPKGPADSCPENVLQ